MEMESFDTDKFIEEIKNRPPIWHLGIEGREFKKQCWDDIVKIFGGKNLTASQQRDLEITLQKKWKSLRGCFTREIKRQEEIKTGYKPGPRKSEYAYFQQLLFLRPVVASRTVCTEGSDHLHYQEDNSCTTDIKREESSDEDESTNNYKEADADSDDHDPLGEVVEHRKVKRTIYDCLMDDEDKLFLLSMLSTLKRIPLQKKLRTKIKLMTVLDEATRNLED